MAPLLPSTPDTSAAEEPAPRVIGLEGEDADEMLDAISSGTAREVLAELHDEPAPPSELSDRVGTSLQNVQYHLGRLDDAGLIEVIDTVYSEKGREMEVYAPADRPLVLVAGGEEQTTGLQQTLTSLLGGVGALAVVSLLVQTVFGGFPLALGAGGAGAGGATPTPRATETGVGLLEATSTPAPTPVAGGGSVVPSALTEPGAMFFAGGVAVLVAWFAIRSARS